MRKVYTYCNESGTLPVIDFINLAGKKFMKKFDFVLKYIQNEKECLCEPYVKHFKRDRRDTEKALEYALKILNLIDTENIDNNERITEVIIK